MMNSLSLLIEKNWARQILVLLLGALSSFAMQPYEFWPVLFLGLSGYWLLLTQNTKIWHSYLSGFLFGFAYFVAGLWWVGNALLVDGNPFTWALPLAVCGLQALLAFFPMMAGGLSQHFAKGRGLHAFLIFVALYGFWEWGRGHMFTGFPWNLFGMTWTASLPMAQIASFGGIHLLNLFTIFLATLPAFLWRGAAEPRLKKTITCVAIVLAAANWAWGYARLKANPTTYNRDVVVQIVTPNIPQADKWNPDLMAENFYKTVGMMHPHPSWNKKSGAARAIVLPETALLPEVFQSPEALNALKVAVNAYAEKTYLLAGALRREGEDTGEVRHYNSIVVMDKAGTLLDWFDKFHLVPFGEYIPFQKYIPIGPVAKFAGFQGGGGPKTIDNLNGLPPLSPLVCYEVIFAGHVTDGSNPPEWIVNVTNDAWYGISPGPYQHLAQTQFRAIEEGIPVIRSTNTGISAIIDPTGRILSQSPLFRDFVQEEFLPRPLARRTAYADFKDLAFFLALVSLCLPRFMTVIKARRK